MTRSICEGFQALGVPYKLDPKSKDEINAADVVLCLGDVRSLYQGIGWKRQGKLNKLLAGFTIIESPLDHKGLVLSKSLDRYICFSEWHKMSFELQAPDLSPKLVWCPFGIDPATWLSSSLVGKDRRKILFYKKRAPELLYGDCLRLVETAGYEVEEIVYGSYTLAEYSAALSRNALLVNWVDHETQGISMAEAWAADVPTLAWNPGCTFYPSHGRNYVFDSSSSPYLTPDTGRFFRDSKELAGLLESYKTGELSFRPRAWVLANLTDAVCARKLLDIIENA